MRRIPVLALALLLAGGRNDNAAAAVHFAFYAPIQEDSPVKIVGFENDQSEIRLLLTNTSGKPVSAAFVGLVFLAPIGCDLDASVEHSHRGSATLGYELHIEPHGSTVAAKAGIFAMSPPHTGSPYYPHLPRVAVSQARQTGWAYTQIQVGINAVFFQDGTAWPARLNYFLRNYNATNPSPAELERMSALEHPAPFDSDLLESEAGKCTGMEAVANALQSVQEVLFDREEPQTSNPDDNTLPHLRFSCTIEGPKAICHMPLEGNHSAQPPRSDLQDQE